MLLDVDECVEQPDSVECALDVYASCVNTVGSYFCQCDTSPDDVIVFDDYYEAHCTVPQNKRNTGED